MPPKALPLKGRRYSLFSYSAQEKVQAVLAVWTERCTPADICRQMNISSVMFSHWQQRAMQAMLQALETQTHLARSALSPRLQTLLQRYQEPRSAAKASRSPQSSVQNKIANPPADPAKAQP